MSAWSGLDGATESGISIEVDTPTDPGADPLDAAMVVSGAESVGASEESDPPAHDDKATTAAATIPPRTSTVMRRLFVVGFELRDVSFMVPPETRRAPLRLAIRIVLSNG